MQAQLVGGRAVLEGGRDGRVHKVHIPVVEYLSDEKVAGKLIIVTAPLIILDFQGAAKKSKNVKNTPPSFNIKFSTQEATFGFPNFQCFA